MRKVDTGMLGGRGQVGNFTHDGQNVRWGCHRAKQCEGSSTGQMQQLHSQMHTQENGDTDVHTDSHPWVSTAALLTTANTDPARAALADGRATQCCPSK